VYLGDDWQLTDGNSGKFSLQGGDQLFVYCLRSESDYNIIAGLSTTGDFIPFPTEGSYSDTESPLPKSLQSGYGVIILPPIAAGQEEHGYRYGGAIYTSQDAYAKELIKSSNWIPTGAAVSQQYQSSEYEHGDQAVMIVEEHQQDGDENNGSDGYTILPPRQSGSTMTTKKISIPIFSSLFVFVGLLVL
jgi:hypothetical protein